MTKKIIQQYKINHGDSYIKTGLNIIQIGIQGPPRLNIFFNGSKANPIILGPLGIYQLELTDGSVITSFEISGLNSGQSVIIDTIQEIPDDQGGNR